MVKFSKFQALNGLSSVEVLIGEIVKFVNENI